MHKSPKQDEIKNKSSNFANSGKDNLNDLIETVASDEEYLDNMQYEKAAETKAKASDMTESLQALENKLVISLAMVAIAGVLLGYVLVTKAHSKLS